MGDWPATGRTGDAGSSVRGPCWERGGTVSRARGARGRGQGRTHSGVSSVSRGCSPCCRHCCVRVCVCMRLCTHVHSIFPSMCVYTRVCTRQLGSTCARACACVHDFRAHTPVCARVHPKVPEAQEESESTLCGARVCVWVWWMWG